MPVLSEGKVYTLKDSPFYRLRTRRKLAAILQVSPQALIATLKEEQPYQRRWKHKTDKKLPMLKEEPPLGEANHYRPIDIPFSDLKILQSRIATLLSRVTPPDWLFSPCKGRSYVDNAARHKGARAFWLLDIKDYFPSCTAQKLAHFFQADLQCSPDVGAILVQIATHRSCLPQGSPCSPILAYFCNLQMWSEIETIVEARGLTHSVYADDITVSGSIIYKVDIWNIKKSIRKHGFQISKEKEVSLINGPADVTGAIIDGSRLKLPNRQLKRLFELRRLRHAAKDKRTKAAIDLQIAGRMAQRRQVENG